MASEACRCSAEKGQCPGCAAKIAANPATPYCPNWLEGSGGLMGCGSTDVTEPDDEGLIDCGNCGIWFRKEQAHGQPNG